MNEKNQAILDEARKWAERRVGVMPYISIEALEKILTDYDPPDPAVWLEELHISGDAMIELDHNVPKGKEGAMYLTDLLVIYAGQILTAQEGENVTKSDKVTNKQALLDWAEDQAYLNKACGMEMTVDFDALKEFLTAQEGEAYCPHCLGECPCEEVPEPRTAQEGECKQSGQEIYNKIYLGQSLSIEELAVVFDSIVDTAQEGECKYKTAREVMLHWKEKHGAYDHLNLGVENAWKAFDFCLGWLAAQYMPSNIDDARAFMMWEDTAQ